MPERDQTSDWVTERQDTEPSSEPVGCHLRVLHGDPRDTGKHLALRRGTALVGTSSSCDLHLVDKRVSRRHLEVRVAPHGIGVRDMGSSNGSFVLGNRVVEAVLPYGAQVQIGGTTIELMPLTAQADVGDRSYGGLIGTSESMRHLFALLKRIESSDVTVLVLAETGTGKELVARAIHERGLRREKPFVVFDCASVPRELVESELFGHVKGAFTGAHADRQGVFEDADGGTLFLDEIGELPLDMQVKLLHVLQDRVVARLGATRSIPLDIRVVAATNRDLAKAVEEGGFRGDLYYRLNVVPVAVPPLRERRDDILPLLRQALAGFNSQYRTAKQLSHAAARALVAHDWPGNIRELRNMVERLVVTAPHDVIDVGDLAIPAAAPRVAGGASLDEQVRRIEIALIEDALRRFTTTRAAARHLGVSQSTIVRKLKYGGRGA